MHWKFWDKRKTVSYLSAKKLSCRKAIPFIIERCYWERDLNIETVADLKAVTDKAPTPEEVEDMLFANKIVKNSKSNAIVLAVK